MCRTISLFSILTVCSVCLVTGCASQPPRPANSPDFPSALSRWGEAPGSVGGVTVLAGNARPADGGAEAVLVTIINQGRRPVKLERALFSLAPQLAFDRTGADPAAESAAESLATPRPPAGDERREALPEGTLKPGETARGYLYFDDGPRAGDVQLTARLVDAASGEEIAVLTTRAAPAHP